MRQRNITVNEVFHWSSSIEVSDQYAAFLRGGGNQTDGTICECKTPSTFGKFCEYELYGRTTINENFEAQLKHRSSIFNQYKGELYGDILCLDFRDICDGRQQCKDGWDEENCDKLEFNECDDNEYRCWNGMCIPDQFFLDGYFDCMDNSDEQVNDATICNSNSRSFKCDERLCNRNQLSCGDGQCISRISRIPFRRTESNPVTCYSLREYLYQCE